MTRSPSQATKYSLSPAVREACSAIQSEVTSLLAHEQVARLRRTDIEVVSLVLGSSRSGTTLLFRELSRLTDVLSPRGEETPFVELCLGARSKADSAALGPEMIDEAELDLLWGYLRNDLGIGLQQTHVTMPVLYKAELLQRLYVQWFFSCTPSEIRAVLDRVFDGLKGSLSDSGRVSKLDARLVFCQSLSQMATQQLLTAGYYDRDPLLGSRYQPHPAEPAGPPNSRWVLEEPPLIPILPRRRALQNGQAVPRHILLKASATAYRLPLIRMLFPNASVRIVHLTRNPAASINGLIDGWHHWGFFSRNVAQNHGVELRIKDYSDVYEWGTQWWKFALPPNWQSVAKATLAEVCAFQWVSANRAILNSVQTGESDGYLPIRFEDILRSPEHREKAYNRITSFMGVGSLKALQRNLPVVMATKPPMPDRWRLRSKVLMPVLHSSAVEEMALKLGYEIPEADGAKRDIKASRGGRF